MAASAKPRQRIWSRLPAQILLANLAGLVVLLAGVLVLDQMREGLIEARIANLRSQAELIAGVLEEAATRGAPSPAMDIERARSVMSGLYLTDEAARVRLFDAKGALIADSAILFDRVRVKPLKPVKKPDKLRARTAASWTRLARAIGRLPPFNRRFGARTRSLQEEVSLALSGEAVAGERLGRNGERLVSVSVPVQRVVAVLGVVTVESSDVDAIIAAERRALVPFILVAVLVTLLSSLLLTLFIARPIRKLARVAHQIRRGGPRRALPELSRRHDEIGDLSQAFEAMTNALYDRLGAIESFAADVAHEIKNPLTSIQSAIETLPGVKDSKRRAKLLKILHDDVKRLNRLITDISASSRLDADLARTRAEPVDLPRLLKTIVAGYQHETPGHVQVVLKIAPDAPGIIYGAEEALARVFRNLIDNAITFSPKGGVVQVRLSRSDASGETMARIDVEDQGPGIPPENLESIFKRFYTDRAQKDGFGSHSGLGLAIARQICTAHRGRIWAQNRALGTPQGSANTGAIFTVELPAGPSA